MTQPRSTLISLDATPWYHVVSRCVRRAYLCGFDSHSGRDFEHRRGWIVARLQQLAGMFALDVAARLLPSRDTHPDASPFPCAADWWCIIVHQLDDFHEGIG